MTVEEIKKELGMTVEEIKNYIDQQLEDLEIRLLVIEDALDKLRGMIPGNEINE
jgi:predicted transcriptional regulator